MEPEDKVLLEKILRVVEQNNRIIRHMRREVLIMRYLRVFWILLMFGIALAIYYFAQPYIINAISAFQSFNTLKTVNILKK